MDDEHGTNTQLVPGMTSFDPGLTLVPEVFSRSGARFLFGFASPLVRLQHPGARGNLWDQGTQAFEYLQTIGHNTN